MIEANVGRMGIHMRLATRVLLVSIQIVIAAFYAWSAVLMWGPFRAAPISSKLLVTAIVLWPVLSFAVAGRGGTLFSFGTTAVLALLTALHLIIVLVFLTVAS